MTKDLIKLPIAVSKITLISFFLHLPVRKRELSKQLSYLISLPNTYFCDYRIGMAKLSNYITQYNYV